MTAVETKGRPDDRSIVEQLDALLACWDRSDAPGLIVGIAREGRTIYRRAFGMASLESRVANTPATRMRIGSTSKHFAALLLLLLAEEGVLNLDAQIRQYLPELTGPGGDPTLRELLWHRGGSRCYVDMSFLTGGIKPRPTGFGLATQVRQTGRNFAPGEAMIYNNGGYHLLSLAAERVTGQTFEALVAERLFAPLDMQATASVPSDYAITPGIATMHTPLGNGAWRRGLFPSEEIKGEGAIVSTVDDMLRWARHLTERDRFGAPESWKALLTPYPGSDPERGAYGLGIRLSEYRGLRTVGHTGGVIGGSCDMLCIPQADTEIVLLVNGAPGVTVDLTRNIIDIVLADRVGAVAPIPSVSDYRQWLGDWWSRATGMVYSLVDEDDHLKLQVCTQPYGLDLLPAPNGGVRLPEANLGEIAIDVASGDGDRLRIGFGGETHDYVRLNPTAIDRNAFYEAIIGTFDCPDANATATIEREGDDVIFRIRDGFGETSGPLQPLDDAVAGLALFGGAYGCCLVVNRDDAGKVQGFELNAARTRHLEFHRV